MASRALVISGKTLATTGPKTLAKRPGQVVFPSEKKVSGREIVPAQKGEIVPAKGKTSGRKGKGSKGDTNVSGGRDTSGESGSESGSEKPPQKLSTLLVRGDIVASLLGGGDGAEAIVRENALFQGNKRVEQTGATLNRREGGTGYGRGGGGKRRTKAGATPAPAQTKRVRNPALPSPGGGGEPLLLGDKPAGGSKRPALPSPGGGGEPLLLGDKPASGSKRPALPSPGGGGKPLGLVAKEAATDLAQKSEMGLTEAGKMNPVAMIASASLQGAKENFSQVKDLWKQGKYEEAVSLATENPLNFGSAAAKVQNWISAQIKKL